MTFGGYFLLLCIFTGLYWLGLKINPPMENTIIPEPNNLLRSDEE
tara:strand:+ start:11057 stop:11191 length:135 start_codon:yes stop_codon:yes gene_type:complete